MYISGCLAYQHIEAEIRLIKGNINVGLKTESDNHISLILSYLQVKVLAEGLMNFTDNMKLECFVDSNLVGDIKVNMSLEEAVNEGVEKSKEQGEEEQCQQNILNVPMEAA